MGAMAVMYKAIAEKDLRLKGGNQLRMRRGRGGGAASTPSPAADCATARWTAR